MSHRTNKIIKLGIIGAGAIAEKHLEVMRAIPWLRSVGVVSRTKKRALSISKKFRIDCFDSIQDLITKTAPDGLLILVSADQIFRVTSRLIQLGIPLFIEKPPGLSPKETYKLMMLAKRYKTKNMVGYNRRFYSIFKKGIEIIKKHGPLDGILIEGHERMWLREKKSVVGKNLLASWIYSNSTHTIDLLRFFAGEPRTVYPLFFRSTPHSRNRFAAAIEFKKGVFANYCSYWRAASGWRVVLYGNKVMVEFKPLETGCWTDEHFKTHPIKPDVVDLRWKPGFFKQLEAFGKLVRDNVFEWPMLDLEGAYRTMCLTNQISAGKPQK